MKWLEMKRYVRTVLGDNVDETLAAYSNTVLATFLNEAAVTVAGKIGGTRSFFDGETIAYNDESLAEDDPRREGRYPLPYPCLSIKAINLTYAGTDTQLERLSFDDFEEQFTLVGRSGIPEVYRVEFGSTDTHNPSPGDITLGPLPNGIYPFRVSLYKYPTVIEATDDDAVMELPPIAHKAVCLLAALEISMRHDDTSRMQKLAPMYQAAVEEADRSMARQDRVGPFTVKSMYGPSKHFARRRR